MRRLPVSVLAMLAFAVLIGGCATPPPVPSDVFYRLDVPESGRALAADARFDLTLEIRPFDADGILGERALVYTEGDHGALLQYSYHFWVEGPSQAVQRELADHLRATEGFTRVLTPRFRVRPDIEILGRIGRLEQVIVGEGVARVVVELEIGAERVTRDGGLLVLNTYRVDAPAADASPGSAATAMRAALRDIFDQFTGDLAAALAAQPRR